MSESAKLVECLARRHRELLARPSATPADEGLAPRLVRLWYDLTAPERREAASLVTGGAQRRGP